MNTKKMHLTSFALAMSLGLMTTMTGCGINPDGGGEGGESGDSDEQGNVMEQPIYLASEGGEDETQ